MNEQISDTGIVMQMISVARHSSLPGSKSVIARSEPNRPLLNLGERTFENSFSPHDLSTPSE